LPPDFVIPKDQGATIDEPLLGFQGGVRMDKEKGKSTNLATNKDEGKKKKNVATVTWDGSYLHFVLCFVI